jgi:hypothetical protein
MTDNKPAMITGLIDDWKLRSADVKERLRLKYVPFSPTPEAVAEAEAFLSLSDAERSRRMKTACNEKVEFLISLETARTLYVDPLDRQDGLITEAKVARYPERY